MQRDYPARCRRIFRQIGEGQMFIDPISGRGDLVIAGRDQQDSHGVQVLDSPQSIFCTDLNQTE